MLSVESLPLQDAKLFTLNKIGDRRGWFVETYRKSWIEEHIDWDINFKFDYSSFSEKINTVRGMHAQTLSMPQSKLVTVLHGAIQDVIIDARKNSSTFGQSFTVILSDDIPSVLYVPVGFYHGFKTLKPNTLVSYKLDNYYDEKSECGVIFDDSTLNIQWISAGTDEITISERDQTHPRWNDAYKF